MEVEIKEIEEGGRSSNHGDMGIVGGMRRVRVPFQIKTIWYSEHTGCK